MLKECFHALALLSLFASHSIQAGSILVENLDDSGPGSLRAAIVAANDNPGPDTIEFDGGLAGPITLLSGLPAVTDDVEILGPGAETITVSGNSLHQPFFVDGVITVTISGLTITDGMAEFGGGIANDEGTLTVSDSIFSGNHANSAGGAIDNLFGTLVIERSTLMGNTAGASGFGGAVSNDTGTVTVIESTLSGNSSGSAGGAIDSIEGQLTIVRSTLSGNSSIFGGAVENADMLTIVNSTFSANSADTGGAVDNFNGDVTVDFSTLTGNSAIDGGGIENSGTLTIKNSLVVNSTAGEGPTGTDCDNTVGATFNALGANFATDASCPGFTESTPGAVNLGPLDDNGGPTQTHALLSGSVAIDAASDCTLVDGATPVTQDQRTEPRPQGTDCDSGAFEVVEVPSDLIMMDGFEDS